MVSGSRARRAVAAGRRPPRHRALSALACVVLSGLLLLASAAHAAKLPKMGWWRGVSSEGTRIAFAVDRVDGQRAVVAPVMGCDTAAGIEFGALHPFGEVDFTFADETAAPSAHAASPILRSGRIDTRARTLRGPHIPDTGGREDETYESPIGGRLTGDHARLKLTGKEIWGSTWCTDASHPEKGDVLEVEAVAGADRVEAGVWQAEGLLPFGDIVDYAAARFYVQPSGVAGNFQGTFLGPSTPPPDRKPNPLFSPWPVPCFLENISEDRYEFDEVDLVDATPIGADGSLHTLGGIDPDATSSYGWVKTDGAFSSPTSYDGSYQITESPTLFNPNWCIDVTIPFEAEKVDPAALAVIGGLEDDPGPKVEPPDKYLPVPLDPTDYVALGDSYSSGEGVPPFDPETATDANACHRSGWAYSRVFNPPGYRIRRSFFACSGATTDNVGKLDANENVIGTPQYNESGTQLGRLSLEQWRPTDLITITIGGNDALFSQVLKECLIRPVGHACHKGERAQQIIDHIAVNVPPALRSAYQAIQNRVPRRPGKPNATIVVLGYPQLFPDRRAKRCMIRKQLVSRKKQLFLRQRGKQLNDIIEAEAAAAEFHYVDVEGTFAGHEPCGKKKRWIHAINLPTVYSFHPNRDGQRAYADRLEDYFICLNERGFGFRNSGIPYNPGGPNNLVVPEECTD